MEIRKTSVWISRSLGLLFVFSSFGHLVGANSSKSQVVVQKGIKKSHVSGSTSRMATLQRVFKKYWFLGIPVVIGVGGLYARWLKNNSVVQNDKSNSAEIKSKTEQSGAAQEEPQLQQLEESESQKLISQELSVPRDGEVKPSEPTESFTAENGSAWWQNQEHQVAWLKDNQENIALGAALAVPLIAFFWSGKSPRPVQPKIAVRKPVRPVRQVWE